MTQSPLSVTPAFHVKQVAGDTIYALSSGRPPAAIAVVRLSGPHAGTALEALCRKLPAPRRAVLRRLRDGAGEVLDDALVLWLPGPASETGEDMAELHLHGGAAVIAAVFEALARLEALRPAGPGEFTRRAFDNGRLDLTQAEAIADLIDAETHAQRRQAQRQMEGSLGRLYEDWRGCLLQALALIEAELDFSDEGDVPGSLRDEVIASASMLRDAIAAHLADGHRGERLRDGVRVVIAGPPNAGKSSLLNALTKRDAAIVSQRAGTTRDVIEVTMDLGGYPVVLCDTAGLRDALDEIEEEGVRRSHAALATSDIVLWLSPAGEPVPPLPEQADRLHIAIASKADIKSPAAGDGRLALSVKTGAGVGNLLDKLSDHVARSFGRNEAPVITRARHRFALQECLAALERFHAAIDTTGLELAAEDLRLAARALGRITGRVDVEQVLDTIFSSFCIGK